MTGKDEVFIDMIEFALDWGYKPSEKKMKKYHELIERRRLNDLQCEKRQITEQSESY